MSGMIVPLAAAQAPGNPSTNAAQSPTRAAVPASSVPGSASRSVIRHNPWPYPPSPRNADYGFRNPGGVGRNAEYYPPGDRFQNDSPRNITAQIGNGGQPDRAEQIAAYNAGTARYRALQSHMDRYAHPFGFGYGFGMGYGFGVR
jgi:hypothetical protein